MKQWLVLSLALAGGAICVVMASDGPPGEASRGTDRPESRNAVSRQKLEASGGTSRPAKSKGALQDSTVRGITDSLLAAHQRHDAKAFAALFTPDGEYIDADETVLHGRKAITEEFATVFHDAPELSLKLDVVSVRSIGRSLLAADCTTQLQKSEQTPYVLGRCRIICVREADAWQIASLQEWDDVDHPVSHHTQVARLDWMLGDWIGEGRHSQIHFSCRWDESGNYLLREFSIDQADEKSLSGTQRIGYDPMNEHLKMWVFDSHGGFSEGCFHRDGDRWVVTTSGVTPDGQLAAATMSFQSIDDHRMICETTDRFVGGQRIVDAESLTLVRKPVRLQQDAAVKNPLSRK